MQRLRKILLVGQGGGGGGGGGTASIANTYMHIRIVYPVILHVKYHNIYNILAHFPISIQHNQ